jgi:ribonuclease VapC
MIAVDTSAIMAIILKEQDDYAYLDIVTKNTCCITTPVLMELHIVVTRWNPDGGDAFAAAIVRDLALKVMPFTIDHLIFARDAMVRYGKGRGHPAQLNYGDCMSYGFAKASDFPLLYKGGDFGRTDIVPAYRFSA